MGRRNSSAVGLPANSAKLNGCAVQLREPEGALRSGGAGARTHFRVRPRHGFASFPTARAPPQSSPHSRDSPNAQNSIPIGTRICAFARDSSPPLCPTYSSDPSHSPAPFLPPPRHNRPPTAPPTCHVDTPPPRALGCRLPFSEGNTAAHRAAHLLQNLCPIRRIRAQPSSPFAVLIASTFQTNQLDSRS